MKRVSAATNGAFACELVLIALHIVRRPWVARLMQVVLILGALGNDFVVSEFRVNQLRICCF